jgi:CheY-like chemotaxis protein
MSRILIVEDSADLSLFLKMELEWEGYTVNLASEGKTALEIARRTPPDVIVSDIKMPDIDGLELIRRLRQMPELAGVPVIALTGLPPTTQLKQVLGGEFAAHLTKPVDASALCDLIKTLTEKRLMQKAS